MNSLNLESPVTLESPASPSRSSQSKAEPAEHQDPRHLKSGSLRHLLDQEYSRCYRFEGVSDLWHDVKVFFRRVVSGEEGDSVADISKIRRNE